MAPAVDLVTLSGVVALGLVHGAEPGHGWPIAATYALETTRKWTMGVLAGLVIGVGHLVSSLAVVAVFFLAKSYFDITQLWWLNEAAGVLLVLLGIHEYRNGHSHGHGSTGGGHGHDHSHEEGAGRSPVTDEPVVGIRTGGVPPEADDRGHEQGQGHDHNPNHGYDHDHGDSAGHDHSHAPNDSAGDGHGHRHGNLEDAADKGLWGLASAAFVLGFAHEEEVEIIGICAGTDACLSLMVAYALAVIVSLVGLTLLLVAGYYRYEERVKRIAPHFSTISAVVLVGMGLLFIAGVL